jgi:hypothetical protein
MVRTGGVDGGRSAEDAARRDRDMTLDEHLNAFLAYVARLLADFDRYIATQPEDPVKDGAGYRVGAMWLTDAELAQYVQELAAISQPRLANAQGKGRRRRMLYTVLLPAPEIQSDETGQPLPRTEPDAEDQ